jgi:hypothetical protein
MRPGIVNMDLRAEAGAGARGAPTVAETYLKITSGQYVFRARLEEEAAPKTCAAFMSKLPFINKIIHVRWSGESCWVPLGDFEFGVGFENANSYPAPGEILLYPGGYSETEILFPYGACCFASKMGQLAGNHFLTVVEGNDTLRELGVKTLWEGAKDIRFDRD